MELECVFIYLAGTASASSYAFIIGSAVVELRKAFRADD
jgi:hypothetical protein